MKSNVKITLIEPHEMTCNLLIPKTLIVAPRQSGKTESIKRAIKEVEYYKVFVPSKDIMNIKYAGIKNVHLGRDFNATDVDSVAYKIFVDDILEMGEDPKLKIKNISLDSPGIYAATTSILDFGMIQQCIAVRRFSFERICIVEVL